MTDHVAKGLLKRKKIGFLGTGNLAQSIIAALMDTDWIKQDQIYLANRSPGKPQKLLSKYPSVNICKTNEELVDSADIIFLAMKPQDLPAAVEQLGHSFEDGNKIVLSLAAGLSLQNLKSLLPRSVAVVRVMPNTAARVKQAVVGYCLEDEGDLTSSIVVELLSPLGIVVQANEGEEFDALTVACASGTGFVLELMTYWQSWLEDRGFEPDIARKMVIETFMGAAKLADEHMNFSIEEHRNQVTSKKGVTAAGLEKMREMELEGSISMAFEKAIQRNRQLSMG